MSAETPKKAGVVRWANVAARGAHLVAVVGFGAALLGAPLALPAYGTAVVASGALLLLLELIEKPATVFEASGLSMGIKLALVGWLALDRAAPLPVFWLIVAWSAFFAHAPSAFRHARLFRKGATP